jgi:hypothetical protein
MDRTALGRMIGESRLLTAAEKLDWAQKLTRMDPAQMERFERTLTKAAALPWTQQMQQYVQTIAHGQIPMPL